MTPRHRHITKHALTVASWAVTLAVSCGMLLSAFGGYIPPAVTCIGAIAAMLMPVMFALTLLVGIVNAIWFHKAAIVSAATMIICAAPMLEYCPLHLMRPSVEEIEQSDKPVLKLMTYNMLSLDDFSKGFCRVGDGNPTLEYVLRENPDILVFQEGEPILKENVKNISADQHRRLLQQYPHTYVNARGMGMLSRYPFEVTRIEHPDRWLYDVYRYDVALPDDTLHIFNLHLQSIGLTRGDKELYHELTNADPHKPMSTYRTTLIAKLNDAFRKRSIQASVVRKAIDEVTGTVVVCGDFNDVPGCYAERVISGKDLRSAYADAGLGPAITYHADRFFFRIDHVLYRGRLRPLRAWSGNNISSDHYSLGVYFRLLPPAAPHKVNELKIHKTNQ